MTETDTRAILAGLAIPVVVVNARERVSMINPAAEAIFGRDLTDRHYATGFRNPRVLEAIEAVLRDAPERVIRYFTRRNDTDFELEARVSQVQLSTGRAVIVSFTDLSQIEEAGQMRRDFVANVSHELKTPLTAMAGFIETLRGAARDDPAARDRFLAIMAGEAERMNRLVKDLLSLSRVEAVERQRPRGQLDLVQLVHMALERIRPLASDHEVEVAAEAPDAPMQVPGDADQLMQVLLNLLENAIIYGGNGRQVVLRLRRVAHDPLLRAPAVQADIIDQGEGIPAHQIPRLTERFYRVDDHRARHNGGTGLGLAIVKHILNRHRGRLRIESRKGEGSCFSVILPAG